MSYASLIFEPYNITEVDPKFILWKGQVSSPPNYNSFMITLLGDLIELNNRRTLEQWLSILKDNNFEYELNFDHEYCKEYIIKDSELVSYSFQIFACDLSSTQNKVEISSEYILPMMFILDLIKNKSYNPFVMSKKIQNALELISISNPDPTNLVMINNLKILERLILVCIDYEVDVKCTIEVRA